jgi:hypothetical protein
MVACLFLLGTTLLIVASIARGSPASFMREKPCVTNCGVPCVTEYTWASSLRVAGGNGRGASCFCCGYTLSVCAKLGTAIARSIRSGAATVGSKKERTENRLSEFASFFIKPPNRSAKFIV